MEIRTSAQRGHANFGWLDSHHTFSFGGYFDPEHIGFSDLRVINEDRVQPARGFDTHGHRDMEIFSYVLAGQLAHRDSMGTGSVIRPGDVQLMSAGTGVRHSEFNASNDAPVHFLQIWIEPAVRGTKPSYQERHFSEAEKRGRLRLIISPEGDDGSLKIGQDARVHAGLFDGKEEAVLALEPGRYGYVHVARGSVAVNGKPVAAGDGVKLTRESEVRLTDGRDAEVLVFDLRGRE